MKILTILGTRPEIIRLSRLIPLLDKLCDHVLVHTGQNYDPALSSNFFTELGLREPAYKINARGTFTQQLAMILPKVEHILLDERPDKVFVLGDTNSSLSAIVAARLKIPVYHMEAGNRSYSPTSPEEVNRRLIDHVSTVLLPYTERSRQNLLVEGIHSSRIFVTGNPIKEVIEYYGVRINETELAVFACMGLDPKRYILVTLHREENVDNAGRLRAFLHTLHQIWIKYGLPVVVSTHPRTRLCMEALSRRPETHPAISFHPPFPFFDFIALQRSAFCVLTDSGTVQEESCILGTPSVILRDHTERPETIECGASVLSGADPECILSLVEQVTSSSPAWTPPLEYLRTNVAETAARILTSHHERGQI